MSSRTLARYAQDGTVVPAMTLMKRYRPMEPDDHRRLLTTLSRER